MISELKELLSNSYSPYDTKCFASIVVMKDGTKIEIMNKEFVEPLNLDHVAYILLADGTKLMVP